MRKFVLFVLALASSVSMAWAQSVQVKGTVTDATGATVASATVSLKGAATPVWTITDVDGRYEIAVPASGVLEFSCYGYVTAQENVNGRGVIDVVLAEATEQLQEAVTVAFGTTTREAFTGSAKVLSSEDIAKSPVTNVASTLAGEVAGVQLTQSSGSPTSEPTIRIRGFGSINAGKDPLIIVDGSPYEGGLNNLNTSDIESMTVLKDAASNALYGARGANGVIMITTKKSKSSKANITFDARFGYNTKAVQDYDVIKNPAQYYELHYAALYNSYKAAGMADEAAWALANKAVVSNSSDGGLGYQVYTVPEGQAFIGPNGKLNPYATLGRTYTGANGNTYYMTPDDWNAEAYRKGVRNEYNFSVAGTEGRINYYASLGYLSNEGIVSASDHERITGRARAEYQAKDWFKVGTNISFASFKYHTLSNEGSDVSTGNVFAFTSRMAPIYPLYVRDGNKQIMTGAKGLPMMDYGSGKAVDSFPGNSRSNLAQSNALMSNLLDLDYTYGTMVNSNAFAEAKIGDKITANVNMTYLLSENRSHGLQNPYYGQFASEKGLLDVSAGRGTTLNLQQLLTYSDTFASRHNVEILLGHEYYDTHSYSLGATKSNMFSQENIELNGAVVDKQGAYSSASEYNNEGFFTRALYDFDNRYYLNASFRVDASSKFAPENRWGTFWSASGSWIVSKESWFHSAIIDEFKLKASIGSQGNDDISSYLYTDIYDVSNSSGAIGIDFSRKGNRDITWETNTNINVGTEFSLLGGRVSGGFDYFNRKTTDMLFSFPVAPSLGYSSVYRNVGDMSNYGAELELTVVPIQTRNVTLALNGNITRLNNRVTKLHEESKTKTVWDAEGNEYNGYTSGNFFYAEGLSMYSYFTKEFAGIDQETGKTLWAVYEWKEVASEEDPEKTVKTYERTTTDQYQKATDVVVGKSTIAPWYGGFGFKLDAYGFDFSMQFTYQMGGWMYDSGYAAFVSSPAGSTVGQNFHIDVLKAWTAENPSKEFARWCYDDQYAGSISTQYLTKASYLNFQNINIGYTLPKGLTRMVLGDNGSLRLYASAENIAYLSARKGFDPRVSYTGTGSSYYSPMRTTMFGVTVKF